MQDAEKKRLFDLLKRLAHGLAMAVGSICEVVVHDFNDPERSIVAIENSHITGRKVGDPLDALGLQVLRCPPGKDPINYRTTTKDGKILRSSSILLRDEHGEVLGAICVNLDITALLKTQELFNEIAAPAETSIEEGFEHNIGEILELLVKEAIRSTGKDIPEMEREDKVAVIAHLDSKGAFLIRYSIDRVAQALNISKFTVYNYLEELKSRQESVGEPQR
jgi:predicted transcriptional regulator YheO